MKDTLLDKLLCVDLASPGKVHLSLPQDVKVKAS